MKMLVIVPKALPMVIALSNSNMVTSTINVAVSTRKDTQAIFFALSISNCMPNNGFEYISLLDLY